MGSRARPLRKVVSISSNSGFSEAPLMQTKRSVPTAQGISPLGETTESSARRHSFKKSKVTCAAFFSQSFTVKTRCFDV